MNKIGENVVTEAGKKGVNRAIDLIMDKFLMPKLDKWINAPKDSFILYDLFKDYLSKKYENEKYMNTIVFQNENKTLDELYIPLTIKQTGKRTQIIVDENMKNIFSQPNKLLITDTAGMGKSTLVKFLLLHCIKKEWGIPIIIELRRLEKNQCIEEYIIDEIQLRNKEISMADVEDLLRRGDFIFFLDGYDEILEENKGDVTKTIRKFISSAEKNSFVLASREDDCLSEFGDFIKYNIKNLNKDEAYALIRKYDENGEVSEALINEIEENANYKALEEFLGNPLMVSLLYLTYRYKGVLQYKKHIFYRQVYDALYDRHDIIKGIGAKHEKKSGLDTEDFRKVLCAMGFISMKQGIIEFDREQIFDLINQAIEVFPEIKTEPSKFLQDILHAVPLFIEEGINFKWAHKSFAEYFAASFICRECNDCEERILAEILLADNNQRFYNMLDFCYDMDYKAVANSIIYPVLCEFISFFEKSKKDTDNELQDIKIFLKYISECYYVKISDKPKPKDRDFVDDLLDALKLYRNKYDDGISQLSYISKSENVMLIIKNKNVYEIVKLMNRKEMDIFTSPKVKSYPRKYLKELEKGAYKVFEEQTECQLLLKNENAVISSIYRMYTDFNGQIFDIEKCKEKVKIIECECQRKKPEFFSLF